MLAKRACPYCNSEETIQIDDACFVKNYDRSHEVKRGVVRSTYVNKGQKRYACSKDLCLNCGMLYEYVSKDKLDTLKKDMEYWV